MMMLRLARAGTKKRPVYHVVAADRRARRDGRFVEQLGYFVPARDILVVNHERIDYWIEKGAQPSETVDKLIKQAKKHGNTEPEAKAAYEPPPAEPVEVKAPAAEAKEAPEAKEVAEGSSEPETKPGEGAASEAGEGGPAETKDA
jgi:small subunit ribosomal protein S16